MHSSKTPCLCSVCTLPKLKREGRKFFCDIQAYLSFADDSLDVFSPLLFLLSKLKAICQMQPRHFHRDGSKAKHQADRARHG